MYIFTDIPVSSVALVHSTSLYWGQDFFCGCLDYYVKYFRETVAVTVSVTTISTPQVLPSNLPVFGHERAIKITVSSRGDLLKVDKALRAVFQDKYQVMTYFFQN